jgi:hypothetical protein
MENCADLSATLRRAAALSVADTLDWQYARNCRRALRLPADVPTRPAHRARPHMARRSGLRNRRSAEMSALRTAYMLAFMRGTSAGIFNLFAASPPPLPAPPALPPPPPACPAAHYQFSTAWIAPVAASIATRFGVPSVCFRLRSPVASIAF